jgi:uncharacterized lipoprotein YajG
MTARLSLALLAASTLLLAACQPPPATTVTVDPVTGASTVTAEPGAPAVAIEGQSTVVTTPL